MSRRYLFFLLIIVCNHLAAQQIISGKIYSAENDSLIPYVTILNKTTRHTSYAGKNGTYSIPAAEGDTLVFSTTGFTPNTVKVQYYMLLIPYDVTMKVKAITLENVNVGNSYSRDSAERRNYYANVFKKKPGITGGNGPDDGVGASISPLSFFSTKAKEDRELKKRLLRQDQEDYIDKSFPAEWIKQLTGLHDDSLVMFMYRYRPSYKFCLRTSRTQMLGYINDKFKEYKKPKAQQ